MPMSQQFANEMKDPNVPTFAKSMMSAFASFADQTKKDVGACMAAVKDMQAMKPDVMSAVGFASTWQAGVKENKKKRVEATIDRAIMEGRFDRRDKPAKMLEGMEQSDTTKFSATSADSQLDVWEKNLLSRERSPLFTQSVIDNPDSDPNGSQTRKPFAERVAAKMRNGGRELAYPLPEKAADLIEIAGGAFRRRFRSTRFFDELLPEHDSDAIQDPPDLVSGIGKASVDSITWRWNLHGRPDFL